MRKSAINLQIRFWFCIESDRKRPLKIQSQNHELCRSILLNNIVMQYMKLLVSHKDEDLEILEFSLIPGEVLDRKSVV